MNPLIFTVLVRAWASLTVMCHVSETNMTRHIFIENKILKKKIEFSYFLAKVKNVLQVLDCTLSDFNLRIKETQNIDWLQHMGSGCEYVDMTLPYGTECIISAEDAGQQEEGNPWQFNMSR